MIRGKIAGTVNLNTHYGSSVILSLHYPDSLGEKAAP